jgi:UDP-N-acetylglucosamine acyltransferase
MDAAVAPSIHPTAIVSPGARLGTGVSIGPWCSIGPEVTIGDGARLMSHVVVDGRTRIGEGAVLYPFVTVGLPPQDLKYRGEPTETEIGPRTTLREHVTVHRGTVTGSGLTRVGADCLLMAVVHIAHDCAIGDQVIIANNVVMGGHVTIGERAVIGGASALHQFVRIGHGAMVGGVSGVEGDVIPYGRVMGNRARLVGLNLVGLRRRGVDREGLHALRRAVLDLFASETRFADNLARVRAAGPGPLVREILDFIDAPSHRGLIRRDLAAGAADEA